MTTTMTVYVWHKWEKTRQELSMQASIGSAAIARMYSAGWLIGLPQIARDGQWRVETKFTASPLTADFGECVRAAEDWLYAGGRLGTQSPDLWAKVVRA